jgi:sterol 14-demethylase
MAIQNSLQTYLPSTALRLLVIVAIPLVACIRYLSSRLSFPHQAPKLASQNYPIVGALGFVTERWTFCQRASVQSPTGNYSFHLGKHRVVGVSGEEGRKVFFENKQLGLSEGYP